MNLILQSIRRERGLFALWIASLAIAVSGLLIADIFRGSLSATLETEGRNMLTADLSVGARRALTEKESADVRTALPADARLSRLTEMFAMATHGKTSRLASLRFIDDDYPLRGELSIATAGRASVRHGDSLAENPQIWVAPDLLTLVQVKEGDRLKIGEVEFQIAGVVATDPSQTFRFGSMAPRIFIHRKFLAETKLMQIGSTFSENLFVAVQGDVELLKKKLEAVLPDPAVQVTIPSDLEQGSLRVLSRLMDFLGLTGLVTLCLGWVGVYYLGRRWLNLESGPAGILKCLGLSDFEIQTFLLVKLIVILTLGIAAGAGLAWAGAQTIFPLVKDSLPHGFALSWSWRGSLLLLLIGPVAGILLLFPALRSVAQAQALALVQGLTAFRARWEDALVFTLTSSVLFFSLTLAQARSWRVTFIFLGALLATVLAVMLLGLGTIRLARLFRESRNSWQLHLAISLWTRRPAVTVLLITVSALAGLLAQLVPNIEKTLVGELQAPQASERPALFLFDVQDEQIEPLKEFLKQNSIAVAETAPLVRARILKHNGQNFERALGSALSTREEENDSRFRNRGVNLSYRSQLTGHEHIVAGKPFSELGNTLENAEVAVETGYADRLGFKLGDVLNFDVQGIEFEAKIASLRDVDWDSFQPNFFMLFPAGVLDPAPKTWILTVQRNDRLSPAEMQALISAKFSNVTSINVQEALDNLSELFAKLGGGLRIASGICMALGLFVYMMILLFQLVSSDRDRAQLQLLGLTAGEILGLQFVTYGLLAVLGMTLGSAMSIGVAGGLARFAFKSRLAIDWTAMIEVYAISLAVAAAGLFALSLRPTPKLIAD